MPCITCDKVLAVTYLPEMDGWKFSVHRYDMVILHGDLLWIGDGRLPELAIREDFRTKRARI